MLILLTVTTYVGTDSIEYSKVVKFISYMQVIQKKVDLISETENYSDYGTPLTEDQKDKTEQILNIDITEDNNDFFRYFNSDEILACFELEDIEDQIVVNFKTREVISLNGVQYEGQIYNFQYNLPGGQKLVSYEETEREVTIGSITSTVNGLNGTFTILGISIGNGTLSYGKMEADTIKWRIITNRTEKNKEITTENITESGKYYFKLVDNLTGNDNADENGEYPSQIIRLTNKPKILEGLNETTLSPIYNYSYILDGENPSELWAKITATDNKKYVWIPRFAYLVDENREIVLDENNKPTIEFLRGTTDVTSSGGYINLENWVVPEVFGEGIAKKTGVWILLPDQANTGTENNNLDIIDVLSGTIL